MTPKRIEVDRKIPKDVLSSLPAFKPLPKEDRKELDSNFSRHSLVDDNGINFV